MDYLTAKKELLSGNLSVCGWFKKNNYELEYAYSQLIMGKTNQAYLALENISNYDIRADWLKKLILIIENKSLFDIPSYLQVRNFLEIDLNLFLELKKDKYVEVLLNNGEFFYDICKESYKFMGRALYYNGLKDLALKYFLYAKNKFYNDAELHFLLGKLYKEYNEKTLCKKHVKICLKLIPEYKPAIDILKEVSVENIISEKNDTDYNT